MSEAINIYCDESCHLENDGLNVMVLGAVWCPQAKVAEVTKRLREIREKNDVASNYEIKWGRVSPAKLSLYMDWLNYFFDDDDLNYRAVVVPDKSRLNHVAFSQDHDAFYYKMYFQLLKQLLQPTAQHYIYLDIKDSRSAKKVEELRRTLSKSRFDIPADIVARIQNVRSHEVGLVQLTDLLTGIIGYANRELDDVKNNPSGSMAKRKLVARMRERAKIKLTLSTLPLATKVNLFRWEPKEVSL